MLNGALNLFAPSSHSEWKRRTDNAKRAPSLNLFNRPEFTLSGTIPPTQLELIDLKRKAESAKAARIAVRNQYPVSSNEVKNPRISFDEALFNKRFATPKSVAPAASSKKDKAYDKMLAAGTALKPDRGQEAEFRKLMEIVDTRLFGAPTYGYGATGGKRLPEGAVAAREREKAAIEGVLPQGDYVPDAQASRAMRLATTGDSTTTLDKWGGLGQLIQTLGDMSGETMEGSIDLIKRSNTADYTPLNQALRGVGLPQADENPVVQGMQGMAFGHQAMLNPLGIVGQAPMQISQLLNTLADAEQSDGRGWDDEAAQKIKAMATGVGAMVGGVKDQVANAGSGDGQQTAIDVGKPGPQAYVGIKQARAMANKFRQPTAPVAPTVAATDAPVVVAPEAGLPETPRVDSPVAPMPPDAGVPPIAEPPALNGKINTNKWAELIEGQITELQATGNTPIIGAFLAGVIAQIETFVEKGWVNKSTGTRIKNRLTKHADSLKAAEVETPAGAPPATEGAAPAVALEQTPSAVMPETATAPVEMPETLTSLLREEGPVDSARRSSTLRSQHADAMAEYNAALEKLKSLDPDQSPEAYVTNQENVRKKAATVNRAADSLRQLGATDIEPLNVDLDISSALPESFLREDTFQPEGDSLKPDTIVKLENAVEVVKRKLSEIASKFGAYDVNEIAGKLEGVDLNLESMANALPPELQFLLNRNGEVSSPQWVKAAQRFIKQAQERIDTEPLPGGGSPAIPEATRLQDVEANLAGVETRFGNAIANDGKPGVGINNELPLLEENLGTADANDPASGRRFPPRIVTGGGVPHPLAERTRATSTRAWF